MLALILRLLSALSGDPSAWPCDAPGEPATEYTLRQRLAACELSSRHLRSLGARPIFVAFERRASERESDGRPSVLHDGGAGAGLHGLNVRLHAAGRNLCDPRESAEAVQDLAARCIARHGPLDAFALQACYAGRFECIPGQPGDCTADKADRTHRAICRGMEARGFSCSTPITMKDLGR